MGIGGEDVRLAVDCSSLEPPVMVAGSMRLRRKKKGKISICGVLSLLGLIKHKLDRVFAGPAAKPNRRRKWVCVLGLTTFGGGWGLGLDQKSDSGQCLFLGLDSGLGQKTSLGLILELDLVEPSPLVPSKGIFLGFEDGLKLATRGVLLLSSVVGVEPSSCLGVLAPSVGEPSSSVFVRGSAAEGFDAGLKGSSDSSATKATPATAASIGYAAGDGFGDGNGSAGVAMMSVPGFPFPSAKDFPVGFLSRDWEDFFSLRPADCLGVPKSKMSELM